MFWDAWGTHWRGKQRIETHCEFDNNIYLAFGMGEFIILMEWNFTMCVHICRYVENCMSV